MAAAASARVVTHAGRRKSCWTGTPEVYFTKAIDNSRLVKVEDPRRSREMTQFAIALGCLFLLVMTFTWQHFKAIEYGYRIEAVRSQRDGLLEINHALRLEQASLRDPERIDVLARKLGMQPLQAGQVIRMDAPVADTDGPVMASVTDPEILPRR
ncbi:MAG TPA: cell division protein FtsL [Terriglobales bacterium]|jgi:cell division protein FtsL